MEIEAVIEARITAVLPCLDERQRRIYLAAEAQSLGWGGVSKIAKLSRVSRRTIAKGGQIGPVRPLPKRVRAAGGGRKKATENQPEMLAKIESLVAPHTMGNPTNPLIWTSKSVRKIADELVCAGFKASHEIVRSCLKNLGFSLPGQQEDGGRGQRRRPKRAV